MRLFSARFATLNLLFWTAISCLFASRGLSAQTISNAGESIAAPMIAARVHEAIRVDGRLDEASWASAQRAPTLVQILPRENTAESNATDVRVVVDKDAIYIGARMTERDPRMMRRRLARRDEHQDGDTFEVFIDSRHDHLTAYHFRVSAGGALYDGQVVAIGTQTLDDGSWDAVWQGVAHADSAGWTAEMRIPFSQLAYTPARDAQWGICFVRYSWNRQELDQYPFWSLREPDSPARYAHILIPGELPRSTPLELRPYVSTRANTQPPAIASAVSPARDYSADAGLDLRARLSPVSVLNLTVNPDFGQVEVDPAVVNLTAFETFFPEKRPFFVEGQNAFTFAATRAYTVPLPPPTTFFSRRIGRAPQVVPSNYDAVDVPPATRILGAAKLTGRTSNGFAFGVLEAATSREDAAFLNGTQRGSTLAEPATNYLVMRGTRELSKGLVRTGTFFSAANRSIGDSTVAAQLRSSAYIAGVDLAADFMNRAWLLDASATGSLVRGTPAAIARTQRSVTHYYQRPDRRGDRLDTTLSSLTGSLVRAALTKGAGSWAGSIDVEQWSPGLEMNDMGFLLRSARRGFATDVHYFQSRRRGVMQWWTVGFQESHDWNWDGDRIFNQHTLIANSEFTNASRFSSSFTLNLPVLYEFLTRGGPLTITPRTFTADVRYETDRRKRFQLIPHVRAIRDAAGERSVAAQLPIVLTFTSSLNMVFTPAYRVRHGVSELLASRANGPASTYGTWYDFGRIEERELAMETRVNWTLRPTVSLQFYGQPLMSSGIYSEYVSLRRASSFEFDPYTGPPLDADFNLRSLRGNAVLRWEYAPGSTAYVVWQQRREGFADEPLELSAGRDSRELLALAPRNVFSIKIAHWLGR